MSERSLSGRDRRKLKIKNVLGNFAYLTENVSPSYRVYRLFFREGAKAERGVCVGRGGGGACTRHEPGEDMGMR